MGLRNLTEGSVRARIETDPPCRRQGRIAGLWRIGGGILAGCLVLVGCAEDTSVSAEATPTTTGEAAPTSVPRTTITVVAAETTTSTTSAVTTSPPTTAASPSTAPVPTALGPLDPDDPYGPMAMFAGYNGHLAGAGPGALEITDDCVLFHEDPEDRTFQLVWGDQQARWDPDERAILFDNPSGPLVRLRSGDRLNLGGSGGATVDPDTGEVVDPDTGKRREWDGRSELGTDCEFDFLWAVSLVRRVS